MIHLRTIYFITIEFKNLTYTLFINNAINIYTNGYIMQHAAKTYFMTNKTASIFVILNIIICTGSFIGLFFFYVM